MNAPDPRVVAALAELRELYALELPPLVAALAATVSRVRVEPAAVAEARVKAHRLRGTAGSYGFHAVSEAVGRLERTLTPPPLAWGDVDAALDGVLASLLAEDA